MEPYQLVALGEGSPLKTALNEGVANLLAAEQTEHRPHLCLNGEEGLAVLRGISNNPAGANTEYWLRSRMVEAGRDVWLNIHFYVFLGQISFPSTLLELTPQQTSCIVSRLPQVYRNSVLARAKEWYLNHFLVHHEQALATIRKQFEEGDPLLKSDHDNRIFDLHGGRSAADIPYTEIPIVGEQLAWSVLCGGTWFEYGSDGYERADRILAAIRSRQMGAVNYLFDLLGQRR
ncbi:MAG TPA: hypothetical protein PK263_03120 [bacterium]|nr:hypothetical protein [bacterium]